MIARLFAQAGAANSPCVTTGELWTVDLCCTRILLGPALLPAGAWRQKAEGITLTVTVSSAHYRRVPASDRPPAALTFVLGADWELRSTGSCADRRVFHYCWALGIVGNHHFQWNTIVSECRTRGNAASCVYNIIWVTRRWRSRESTRKLLEKELRKNRCLKHWSIERQRRHLNLHGGRGRWGGSDRLRRLVRAEQIPSQHLQVRLWCLLGPFPSFSGTRNRRLNSSSNEPDVFSQKCASYPNCWALNVACLQSPLQTSSTHAHVLLKGRERWTVSLHLWDEVVSGCKSSVSSHFL